MTQLKSQTFLAQKIGDCKNYKEENIPNELIIELDSEQGTPTLVIFLAILFCKKYCKVFLSQILKHISKK